MTFSKTLALIAMIASQACAFDDDYLYSREGADLNMVILVNGPALTSPSVNLNLSVDSSEDFKHTNRVTPLGQRQ